MEGGTGWSSSMESLWPNFELLVGQRLIVLLGNFGSAKRGEREGDKKFQVCPARPPPCDLRLGELEKRLLGWYLILFFF